jgi:hypothetical protein
LLLQIASANASAIASANCFCKLLLQMLLEIASANALANFSLFEGKITSISFVSEWQSRSIYAKCDSIK